MLFDPGRLSHEQESGHVRADKKKHESHRAPEREERWARAAENVLHQAQDMGALMTTRVPGVLLVQLTHDPGQLGFRLLQRDPGLQATDHEENAQGSGTCAAPLGPLRNGCQDRTHRRPYVRASGVVERGRHDAHHRDRIAAFDRKASANRGRLTAEPVLPEPMTDDDHPWSARRVILWQEAATMCRFHAECFEKGVRDRPIHPEERLSVSHKPQSPPERRAHRRHVVEGGALGLPVLEVREGDLVKMLVACQILLPHDDETILIGKSEGSKEDGVDDAEYRDVHPQTDRERRDRGGIQPGVTIDAPESVSDFPPECFHSPALLDAHDHPA